MPRLRPVVLTAVIIAALTCVLVGAGLLLTIVSLRDGTPCGTALVKYVDQAYPSGGDAPALGVAACMVEVTRRVHRGVTLIGLGVGVAALMLLVSWRRDRQVPMTLRPLPGRGGPASGT